ncbi:MAG TPA: hypothetical protein VK624_15640 [Steroidobacteraceae bacterium]|nr:hypothetical protein [Steroidobacteraceae bacterium]
MDFDAIRPLVTGCIGAMLTAWLTSRWARFVPRDYLAKSGERLLEENRSVIWICNALFLLSVATGIVLFKANIFASNNWWGPR